MTLLPKLGWSVNSRKVASFDSIDVQLRKSDRIISPSESLRAAILQSSSGGTDPDGVRIYLAPGVFFVRGTESLLIERAKVNIIALAPGQSVIRRNLDDPSVPMLKISGSECSLRGLVLDDDVSATGVARTSSAVEITGDKAVIEDCHIVNGYFGIKVTDCDWPSIRNNRIITTAGGYPIHLNGSGEYAQVLSNLIEKSTITSPNAAVYADDGWENSSFLGNVTASSDVISYKTGLGNVNAANVGTVTVRP